MEIEKYAHGEFCWAELATSNVETAKKFYGSVFGWTYKDIPLPGDMGVYSMCELGGREVGAMFKSDPRSPAPPHWGPYVSCTSVDEIAGRVSANKGTVVVPPMDVMDAGRMVVMQDPTGAVVSAWEPKAHLGFGRKNEHGSPCWLELMTTNIDIAAGFYSRVFDWKLKHSAADAPIHYTEFLVGEKSTAGMMAMDPSWGPMPPMWNTYFQTSDIKTTLALVVEHGGKLAMPSTKVPKMGEFAVVSDPTGAHFSLIQFDSPSAG